MIKLDPATVESARHGDRAAIESLLRAAEPTVYNLAMRMLAHPADAEDATQEILIKIIVSLGGLRDIGAAGGWAMRIACRHLVNSRKRSRIEAMRITFDGFARDLEQGLHDPIGSMEKDPETALAIEEIKIGCTLAMLTCLSRSFRITYLLGEVFELTDLEAASVLGITPAAYRQRLRRSREAVGAFVAARCGIVSENAACRCEKRIAFARSAGRVSMGKSQFGLSKDGVRHARALRSEVQRLEESRRVAALLRSNPDFLSNIAELVMQTITTDARPSES